MQIDLTLFVLLILLAFALGGLIFYLWSKMKYQNIINQNTASLNEIIRQKENDYLQLQKTSDDEKHRLEKQTSELKQQYENDKLRLQTEHLKKISELEKIIDNQRLQLENWKEKWEAEQSNFKQKQEALHKEFKLLAQNILEEKAQKFNEVNEANMKQILNPFQQAMKEFKEKVEKNEEKNSERHTLLQQQLYDLKELNRRLSQDALNLTKALKGDSKTQGVWGETILNRLLEKSGLEKNREYFVQQSYQASEDSTRQRLRPDVVIHLPDNKKLVIDAKVSLTAYERYINEEDENQVKTHIKQHLQSIKAHINGLTKKSYPDLLEGETPEFILMFIPAEPAFSMALKEEPELYNYAFERNIVMVTPSTLLATLKIVDNMWQNEKQRQNAYEIAKQAGSLYDKFHGLISDLQQVENRLTGAKKSFDDAMGKLHQGKGNLISKVEKLKKLGAKTKKQLPQTDTDLFLPEE